MTIRLLYSHYTYDDQRLLNPSIAKMEAKWQVKLRCTTLIGELLVITSPITRNVRRFLKTKANISLKDGTPIAEGKATQFIIKPKVK